jgi:hypothetical protein
MKRISKALLKGLLIVVLFTGGSILLSTTGVKTVSEANAAQYQQVYDYLVARGYTVITLNPLAGTKYDWIGHTVKDGINYTTTITCTSSGIIDHTDVPC